MRSRKRHACLAVTVSGVHDQSIVLPGTNTPILTAESWPAASRCHTNVGLPAFTSAIGRTPMVAERLVMRYLNSLP